MQYDPTTIRSWMLKVSSFWRLDKLPVMRGCHFFLQLGQYILHAVLSLPICKKPKFLWFNLFHINLDYISDNNGFKLLPKSKEIVLARFATSYTHQQREQILFFG